MCRNSLQMHKGGTRAHDFTKSPAFSCQVSSQGFSKQIDHSKVLVPGCHEGLPLKATHKFSLSTYTTLVQSFLRSNGNSAVLHLYFSNTQSETKP